MNDGLFTRIVVLERKIDGICNYLGYTPISSEDIEIRSLDVPVDLDKLQPYKSKS